MTRLAPLLAIRPDPNQPRSLLPVDLVGLFTNGLMTPQAIMSEWQKYPNSALAGIVTLADSIAQHGQINPISVQQTQSLPDVKYLIVTGERRWWAHVLLLSQGRDIYEGDTRNPADQIKITLVSKGVSIRAHQMIENVVREDINAVEKAHGCWALRYELSGKDYQQVRPTSAEEKYLVGWDKVEKSLGVSSRYRQYVIGVLKLTPDARRLVGEHGLSESTIRPITQKLHKYPDLQIKALMKLVDWQESQEHHSLAKEVKQMVSELVAEIPQVGSTPRPSLLPLEVPALKKTRTSQAPSTPKPSPSPVPAPVTGPAPKPIPKPIPIPKPVMASASVPQVCNIAQKPLIATPRTLHNRPQETNTAHQAEHDLRQACARLITALDQKSLTDIQEELMTLKYKIDQLLK